MAAKKKTTKKPAAKKAPAKKKPVTKKSTPKKASASTTTKNATKKAAKTTAKKTPVKKTQVKKAPVKKAAPRQTPPLVVDSATTTTTIVARIDAGFGNAVFVRGATEGLSWSRGERMRCENASEWHFTLENVADDFEAKLLLNDDRWAAGDNFVVTAGETVVVEPQF